MRKLESFIYQYQNGMASPSDFEPLSTTSIISLSPASSPSPSPSQPLSQLLDMYAGESIFIPSIVIAESAFDLATVAFIAGILLLSVLSFWFIFHLRLRSRRLHHLMDFNCLWTVRFLLVAFVSLWAINEILRLPNVRQKYFYPFISLNQQANLCKVHVVLSLGLLEPGFLVTLLFLVIVSINRRNPCRMWAIAFVCIVCFPMTVLQAIVVYFSPLESQMPRFVHGSSVLTMDDQGNTTVLCTYPFFSCVVFWAFAIVYALAFLMSCWRVLDFVINKSIRVRINLLATTIMVALPIQVLCLGLSWLWLPQDSAYGCVVIVMFFCVMCCMAVGEVILIIKPITEALVAGGDSLPPFPWQVQAETASGTSKRREAS